MDTLHLHCACVDHIKPPTEARLWWKINISLALLVPLICHWMVNYSTLVLHLGSCCQFVNSKAPSSIDHLWNVLQFLVNLMKHFQMQLLVVGDKYDKIRSICGFIAHSQISLNYIHRNIGVRSHRNCLLSMYWHYGYETDIKGCHKDILKCCSPIFRCRSAICGPFP